MVTQTRDPFNRYEPEPSPDVNDREAVVRYLLEEYRRLASFTQQIADGQLTVTTVEPSKPRTGMLRLADGVQWDPGSGRRQYWYDEDDAAWHGNMSSMAGGTLSVPDGGTGLPGGTSGGILAFTAPTVLASSAALGAGRLVIGGGVGVVPGTPLDLGLATQVLHGNILGVPTWGAVGLTTDVTGVLPMANGGTNKALLAANGGVAYSDADSLELLAPTATVGQLLRSGANAAPSWSTNLTYVDPTLTLAGNSAAGISVLKGTGSVFVGTTPHVLFEEPGVGAGSWSGGGTLLGFNVTTGLTGNVMHIIRGGSSVFSVSAFGTVFSSLGIANSSSLSNAYVQVPTTGALISRNIGDSNVALRVQQQHASSTGDILQMSNSSGVMSRLTQGGRLFVGGSTTPTANLHLPAGGTAANSAPFKLTHQASRLATAEPGTFQLTTDKLYLGITTGPTEKEITLNDAALTSGRFPGVVTNGRLTDFSGGLWDGTLLTVPTLFASAAYGHSFGAVPETNSAITVRGTWSPPGGTSHGVYLNHTINAAAGTNAIGLRSSLGPYCRSRSAFTLLYSARTV